MPDKTVRSIDPLGIIALAQVLAHQMDTECSCENKPVNPCSCENKPVCPNQCSCELIPVHDLMDVVVNPVFREAVKQLDVRKLRSIEDFLAVAGEIRAKVEAATAPTRSARSKKKPR
ncbi:hypothetical protein YTPLAS18_35240 [Nitrospira sp.]|nr:hypothetical protein YTPLAS18_35240 [Nitrospira sp.]